MNRMIYGMAALLVVGASSFEFAAAQDAVQANPGKYKVVFENSCVRLLEYSDKPGDLSVQHEHPPHLVYSLSEFEREFVDADLKKSKGKMKVGDVVWVPANKHSGKNIGSTPTHALIFELKDNVKDCERELGNPQTLTTPAKKP